MLKQEFLTRNHNSTIMQFVGRDEMVTVYAVEPGSLASRHGIAAGDIIETINHEKVLDSIDFQALSAARHVCLLIKKPDMTEREVDIIKPSSSVSLGITLTPEAFPPPRECANNCIFCFVDQMPEGMRPSLYIKDDDWRYSLMMGSFITLTNVGDNEFKRIIKRKASPLYISVQATDEDARCAMMNNPWAGKLLDRLRTLAENGISFHGQVVLCPGVNDGDQLIKTLDDLYNLRPHTLSVALVPVGLTRFRKGLPELAVYTREQANEVQKICRIYQQRSMKEYGDLFVYLSDEFLSITSSPIPPTDDYDGFPQIENGVGMLRLFEDGLKLAAEEAGTSIRPRTVCVPCGTSLAPYMQQWVDQYSPAGVTALITPIVNHFFGETVTVTGLITAQDLLAQLKDIQADEVLISETMLNDEGTLFLDDISFEDFCHRLNIPCRIVKNNGEDFYHALCGNQEGV